MNEVNVFTDFLFYTEKISLGRFIIVCTMDKNFRDRVNSCSHTLAIVALFWNVCERIVVLISHVASHNDRDCWPEIFADIIRILLYLIIVVEINDKVRIQRTHVCV